MGRFEMRQKRRQLNTAELTDMRKHATELLLKLEDVEIRKKAVVAEFTQEMRPLKTDLHKATQILRTGIDEDSAWCNVVVDPVTRTVKFFRTARKKDPDTNMMIEEEVLFDEVSFDDVDEHQLTIWQTDEDVDSDSGPANLSLGDEELFAKIAETFDNTEMEDFTAEDLVDWLYHMRVASSELLALWSVGSNTPLSTLYQTFTAYGLAAVLKKIAHWGNTLEDRLEHFLHFLDAPGCASPVSTYSLLRQFLCSTVQGDYNSIIFDDGIVIDQKSSTTTFEDL